MFERHDALVEQHARYVALHDAQGEAFDNGRFADARLADEHGVVLLASAENLGHALDFGFTPDDGVEASFGGSAGHVVAELVEHRRVGAFLCAGSGLGLGRVGRTRRVGRRHIVRVIVVIGESGAHARGRAADKGVEVVVGDADVMQRRHEAHNPDFGVMEKGEQQMDRLDDVAAQHAGPQAPRA